MVIDCRAPQDNAMQYKPTCFNNMSETVLIWHIRLRTFEIKIEAVGYIKNEKS